MSKAVSNVHASKRKAALVIAAVYLCCVLLGCLIIWVIPFAKNRTDLLEIAYDMGEEVLSAGQKEEVMIFGMDYALYSQNGFQLYKINNFLYGSEWNRIANCAGEVFEKGKIFSPAILLLDNRDKDPRYIFGVIVGTLVEGPGGHQFSSVLIRDFADLDTTMIIYIAIFTFLYAIGLIFMTHTLKKERELNRMRRDLIANVSHELKPPLPPSGLWRRCSTTDWTGMKRPGGNTAEKSWKNPTIWSSWFWTFWNFPNCKATAPISRKLPSMRMG